ncbi:hypothetical protein TrST_g7760 [Triparma strigata]|uniref:Uncharacterized protein n=1 Tax=Triparma strigata TaxID=1606541 RepID=A0A9W7EW88_9STRA|nr:hypothetical protein TrST_g7760 [Triparma strigata]
MSSSTSLRSSLRFHPSVSLHCDHDSLSSIPKPYTYIHQIFPSQTFFLSNEAKQPQPASVTNEDASNGIKPATSTSVVASLSNIPESCTHLECEITAYTYQVELGVEVIQDKGVSITFKGYECEKVHEKEIDLNSDDDDKEEEEEEEEEESKKVLKYTSTESFDLSTIRSLVASSAPLPPSPPAKKQKTDTSPSSVATVSTTVATSSEDNDPDYSPLTFSSLPSLVLHLLPFLPPITPPPPPKLQALSPTLHLLLTPSHFSSLQHLSLSLIENGSTIIPKNFQIFYHILSSKIIGYSTVYIFKTLTSSIARICQLCILSPRLGHGYNFLLSLQKHYTNSNNISEINVEDPCPQFSRLRDVVDFFYPEGKVSVKQKKRMEVIKMVVEEGLESCKVKVKRYVINWVLGLKGEKKEVILAALKEVWEEEREEIVKVVGRIERERRRREEFYAD